MNFLTILKILLILALPFLLFLIVLNFVGFDNLFYQEKFSEYNVQEKVPEASSLHEKVINFIKGTNDKLPDELGEREKQHLLDVRNITRISTIVLYALIILFILLLLISAFILKVNNSITNFVGKVLVFGGFLTITLAAALFFFISSDFSGAFESFHKLLFEKGTYTFDPAKEVIVKLYPEQLFMDLGIKISKWAVIISLVIVFIGIFLIFKSKKIKRSVK